MGIISLAFIPLTNSHYSSFSSFSSFVR